MPKRRHPDEDEVSRILADYSDPKEPASKLWKDLSKWVFAQDRDAVDGVTEAQAQKALDDAAARVEGLKTAEDWGSAARYFQAENFHDLEGPAGTRAVAMARAAGRDRATPSRPRAPPATKKPKRASARPK